MQQRLSKILTAIFLIMSFSTVANSFLDSVLFFPHRQNVKTGDRIRPHITAPRSLQNNISFNLERFNLNREKDTISKEYKLSDSSPVASTPGKYFMNLNLFGSIPLHQMVIDVVPPVTVVPGGHSIGVVLNTQGVVVVGQSSVRDREGNRHNPAADSGIILGDIIMKINGKKAAGDSMVRDEVAHCGENNKKVVLEIKRNNKTFTVNIKPVYCSETQRYRIGIFVRDSAAGVGTLSFFEPETNKYGALGHVITDMDTAQKIDLKNGKIVGAIVKGIHCGKRGFPGEKIGLFDNTSNIDGNITKNTRYGIFGTLKSDIKNPLFQNGIPIAMNYEIERGPAEILTVINGTEVERFSIEIQETAFQNNMDSKGLIIKITDPELLQKTGGIIQGMSGSPIIQRGKFAGAVTHVFINDPTRGYGVPAEWMLMEAGLIKVKQEQELYEKVG